MDSCLFQSDSGKIGDALVELETGSPFPFSGLKIIRETIWHNTLSTLNQ